MQIHLDLLQMAMLSWCVLSYIVVGIFIKKMKKSPVEEDRAFNGFIFLISPAATVIALPFLAMALGVYFCICIGKFLE